MHPWEDFRDSYSSRADLGGGVILTLCHPLDTLRWLLGEVEAVWCFSGKLNDFAIEVEDMAEIGLRFASGAIGSVQLDYNRKPAAHHLEIVGSLGTLRWDYADGAVDVFKEESGWKRIPAPEGFERNSMYLAEMRHFLSVVQGEGQPACTLQDGIWALEVALAARRSSDQGVLVAP
jgi:predicted dehydrogenase